MEQEILYRFFEGTASREEEKKVCDWVEASKENRDVYLKERKYYDILLLRKGHIAQSQMMRRVKRFYLSDMVKYAAAIALLFVCGLGIYTYMTPQINTMNTIIVPVGQRVNVLLSDGTNVWVNSGTKIQYPSLFSKGKREITLDGEAYFEVAKDSKNPFIVQTGKYDIEVLGTTFNVNAYRDTDSFTVALLEGAIQIADRNEPSQTTVLSPRNQVVYKQGELIVEEIHDYDVYRWKEGLLCFDGILFKDLMAEFEQTYGINIIVENKNLDNYICSGKFRISDGVDFILQILQLDAKFQFYRSKDYTTVYIK